MAEMPWPGRVEIMCCDTWIAYPQPGQKTKCPVCQTIFHAPKEEEIMERTWRVEGRNNYYAVDEFVNGKCRDMTVAVEGENAAEKIAGALANAYKHGQEERALTITQAGYLSDLIRAVETCSTLKWYPAGSATLIPALLELRAFTDEHGDMFDFSGDIRDSYVHAQGDTIHWLSVREVLKALHNAIMGDAGLDQPMAIIDQRK